MTHLQLEPRDLCSSKPRGVTHPMVDGRVKAVGPVRYLGSDLVALLRQGGVSDALAEGIRNVLETAGLAAFKLAPKADITPAPVYRLEQSCRVFEAAPDLKRRTSHRAYEVSVRLSRSDGGKECLLDVHQ